MIYTTTASVTDIGLVTALHIYG